MRMKMEKKKQKCNIYIYILFYLRVRKDCMRGRTYIPTHTHREREIGETRERSWQVDWIDGYGDEPLHHIDPSPRGPNKISQLGLP